MKMDKELLKKIKMPEAKMADQEAEMDLESLGDEEMPEEAPEEMPEAEEAPKEEKQDLAALTDEVLIEEMKKRGLIEE